MFGARLFEFRHLLGFENYGIYKNVFSNMNKGVFWICLSILASPKIKIIGFEAQGHVQKSRNHRNEGFGP